MIRLASILFLLSAMAAISAPVEAWPVLAGAYAEADEPAEFAPYAPGLVLWIKAEGETMSVTNQAPVNHASSGIVITNSSAASSPVVSNYSGEAVFNLTGGKYWSISPAIPVTTNLLIFARFNRLDPGGQVLGTVMLLGDAGSTPFVGYIANSFRSRMDSDSLGYPNTNTSYGVMVGFCDGVTNCVDFEPDGYTPSADNVPATTSGQFTYIGKRSTSVTTVGWLSELFIYTNGPAISTSEKERMLTRVSIARGL